MEYKTVRAWVAELKRMAQQSDSNVWHQGDLYNWGVATFGYSACRAMVKTVGLNWASLKVCGVCARKFSPRLRRLNLEATKYQAAASLPLNVAMQLLKRAAAHGWTVARVRYEADRLRHGTGPDITGSLTEVIDQGTKFRVILADPPWSIWPTKSRRGGSDRWYPRMSLDDICALRVPEIAHRKSFLFVWMPAVAVTWVARVMQAWGFDYVGQIIWYKTNGPGTGYYVRYAHENLFFGKTPEAPGHFVDRGLNSVIRAPRGKHSEKPAAAYNLIERGCPGPYLDLFARRRHSKRWVALGNQLDE